MSDTKKKRTLCEEFSIMAYNLLYFRSFKNPHDQIRTTYGEIHISKSTNEWNKLAIAHADAKREKAFKSQKIAKTKLSSSTQS